VTILNPAGIGAQRPVRCFEVYQRTDCLRRVFALDQIARFAPRPHQMCRKLNRSTEECRDYDNHASQRLSVILSTSMGQRNVGLYELAFQAARISRSVSEFNNQ